MNLFISVLLLSIWTSTCLNRNQTGGSSTTAVIMLSFCFLHYNCLNDDFPKAETIKKRVAAKLSKSSILSFTRYKRDDSCIPERQPMLADMDKLSEPSGPEMSSSSSETLSTPSSTEKLLKPSRNISESLVNDISEAKKRNVQSSPSAHKVKPFAKSFNKVDSKNNTFYGNVSDSDKMIYDNDGDGERKITITSD
ncbi:uncharacterized protein CXorf66 homolog [Sturnira hondurensis]|uniref:uncharacterized protein CXorf66 homolog n=1 Tax=Sturnira hondurensis TaxID=192404 RepID=UPI00187A9AD1|nr:uncharacterized protein CXorf66 homolog [Sturnira hondurensis]